MITETITRLQYLCDTIPILFVNISEYDFTNKPTPNKWSKKEILGHLIDSATNNHQRFVRAQFENIPTIIYDQNNWNVVSQYTQLDSKHLILFWTTYNRHLIELLTHTPQNNLLKKCQISGQEIHTIGWLFDDYVKHLEYHLRQIVVYK
jgi:DinB superfamily